MVEETLEARVARLERQMTLMAGARTDSSEPAAGDWKQTVGMFRGDAIVAEMIEQSRRLRDEDRHRARETGESAPA